MIYEKLGDGNLVPNSQNSSVSGNTTLSSSQETDRRKGGMFFSARLTDLLKDELCEEKSRN